MVVWDDGDGFRVQLDVFGGVGVGIGVAHEIQGRDACDEERVAVMVGATGVDVYLAIDVVSQTHRGRAYRRGDRGGGDNGNWDSRVGVCDDCSSFHCEVKRTVMGEFRAFGYWRWWRRLRCRR